MASVLTVAMMFVPTVAAVIAVFFVDKPKRKAQALGLVPLKPAGRLIGYLTIALFLPIILCVVALGVGSALGLYPADFTNFGGFQQITEMQLAQLGISELPAPVGVLVAGQFLNVLIAALFINILPALGGRNRLARMAPPQTLTFRALAGNFPIWRHLGTLAHTSYSAGTQLSRHTRVVGTTCDDWVLYCHGRHFRLVTSSRWISLASSTRPQ